MPEERPFWSGTISFGLVSVPVNLFPANRRERTALRILSPKGVPLSRRYYCPKDDKEVDSNHIVRGFELAGGKHVVVTDEELEKLAPRHSRDIDLRRFVDTSQLDPVYFERGYFLTPAEGSVKAYRLLADSMERTHRAGIATFVMRGKEYLVAILAEGGILRAETLRFAGEVRGAAAVGLPKKSRLDRRQVKTFERAIARASRPTLAAKELEDPYAGALRKLVERKRRKGEDLIELKPQAKTADEPIDLLAILKSRMREGKPARRAAAKTPRRARRSQA